VTPIEFFRSARGERLAGLGVVLAIELEHIDDDHYGHGHEHD
jgi:hypothetical protein